MATVSTISDIALLILVAHATVGCVVTLALFFFITRGMIMASRKTREVMPTVQGYARQIADGSEDISRRIAEPVIRVRTGKARVQGMWTRFSAPLNRSHQDESPQS